MSQQTAPGAQTIVDERTETRPDYRVDEGDHERFSHYVPRDKLTEAMVMGTPVVALCGKVWVPSRDPERFPVCRRAAAARTEADRSGSFLRNGRVELVRIKVTGLAGPDCGPAEDEDVADEGQPDRRTDGEALPAGNRDGVTNPSISPAGPTSSTG